MQQLMPYHMNQLKIIIKSFDSSYIKDKKKVITYKLWLRVGPYFSDNQILIIKTLIQLHN